MAKKAENKSFVLRVDAQTWDELERWAEDEFRSVNGQLQWIIADALRRSGRMKKRKEDKAVEED
ncbi:MAG: Arc family DNA-binding protein [Alistipes sp.]|jgi:hypothetical protein|nr:Arc family DNA-binding protein [Alistipes sp.]MBQ5715290.1 Arc family DNA-binding protein [Alistipes sp.]